MNSPQEFSRLLPKKAPPSGLIPPSATGLTLLTLLTLIGLLAMLGWLVIRATPLVDFQHPPAATIRFSLDINNAPAHELALLPGIGPTMAERIINERQQHGSFRSVDDVTRVPGIGPVTIEQIRPFVRPVHPPHQESQ